MKIAAFDIETIPGQHLPDGCLPQFDPDTVKLGNLKDPYKIKEKIKGAELDFEAGLAKKMATDKALCQVCTFVGYIFETDGEGGEVETKAVYQVVNDDFDNEQEIIREAWAFIHQADTDKIPIVTFNGKGFDFPVLLFRAMILAVHVSTGVYQAMIHKWNVTKYHYDLMQILVGDKPQAGRSLEFYLNLFGVTRVPSEMDGSKVYEAWQAGGYDKIREYCEGDVLNTCRLFKEIYPYIVLTH